MFFNNSSQGSTFSSLRKVPGLSELFLLSRSIFSEHTVTCFQGFAQKQAISHLSKNEEFCPLTFASVTFVCSNSVDTF